MSLKMRGYKNLKTEQKYEIQVQITAGLIMKLFKTCQFCEINKQFYFMSFQCSALLKIVNQLVHRHWRETLHLFLQTLQQQNR